MTAPTDAVMDLAVHNRTHHTPQPGCDWCPEVKTARPTDHLAAAREALDDAFQALHAAKRFRDDANRVRDNADRAVARAMDDHGAAFGAYADALDAADVTP